MGNKKNKGKNSPLNHLRHTTVDPDIKSETLITPEEKGLIDLIANIVVDKTLTECYGKTVHGNPGLPLSGTDI